MGREKSVRERGPAVGDHHAVWEWLSLIVGIWLGSLQRRQALVVENLLLRQQLAASLRARPRSRLAWHDRLFWVAARRLCADWRTHLVLVRPETVLRWHRRGWRLCWWWRSRRPTGRPRLPKEVRDLIRRLSEENRLWGTERIRGELLKLHIPVAKSTIQQYLRDARPPRRAGQTWATFLRNHGHEIWACDFLPVTDLLFRPLYAFVVIALGSRRIVHVGVTRHPTDAWVAQQLREATPFGQGPTHLLRDNDRKYGPACACAAAATGIEELRTAYRAPRQNATCERFLGSVRRECLDHLLVLGEAHLRRVLREYVHYFHRDRPHHGLAQRIPEAPAAGARCASTGGRVRAIPILGGLHHAYAKAG